MNAQTNTDMTNATATTKPTLARKVISYSLVAAMLHASVAPAIAAEGQRKQQAQVQAAQAQNDSSNDAVTQMVELAAKHELNVAFIKETEAKKRAGRNIFTRMVDGVIELFTDNSEEIALDEANDETSNQLLALEMQAAKEHAELITELEQQKQTYQEKGFDAQSLQAQDELIAEMNSRYKTLTGLMTTLKTAKSESAKDNALAALNKQLTDWQPKVAHTDMENLPWGTPKNDVREPIVVDQSDINKVSFHNNKNNHLNTAVGQWRETEYKIGNYLLNKQNPPQSLFKKGGDYFIQKSNAGALSGMTAAGNWTVLNALPKEVQPKDLEANQDVQINDDIKALAKQLDHSPAKIYKWVHDNIEFVPTYGSIQGSAYTLDTKRGNSADTASLLIALLRASKVPARYVYGTVDIPAKFAIDWVGGVNNIDAAQNLMGQGGIPSVALMDGAVPKYLRLEHVWVEANVDYIGSRGALSADKTTNNQKQWIPLDASYKSYTRTQGIDLAKAVPFDGEKLLKDAQEGATVDEATGSVKNLNQQAINTAIEDYQTKVKTYLEQNNPNATVGDVLGTSTINEYKSDTLAPMLPYQVKTVVSDYQELPESMRHYFVVNVYQDANERRNTVALGETPNFHVKIPTTDLQGKPLALSFKPSSQADEDKLIALLPKPEENGEIDPAKLPRGLSGINFSPEVTLDGQTLKTGGSYKIGTEIYTKMGYQSPQTNVNITKTVGVQGLSDKVVRAGEYHAIGYDMQGLSKKQLEQTKETLESVKTKLEDYQKNKNQSVLDGITKHDLSGAILQANVQSYFAINDVQDQIAIRQNKNITANRFMSFGTFHTFVEPNMRYGISFGGRFTGMQMDIDRLMRTQVSKNNDLLTLKSFIQSQGVRQSANEHLIPELLFDNPETDVKEAQGISAVKAIQLAAQEGQTIYSITKDNEASVLPKLSHDAGTMEDIHNALNAGKEVRVHESTINYLGWSGSGYIILDADTGAGAYLISGGANGGYTVTSNAFTDFFMAFATIISDIPAYSWLFGLAFILYIASFSVGLFGIVLFSLAILLAGCGFSNYTGNAMWAEISGAIVGLIIGAIGLLPEASGAAVGLYLTGGVFTFGLIFTGFSQECVNA